MLIYYFSLSTISASLHPSFIPLFYFLNQSLFKNPERLRMRTSQYESYNHSKLRPILLEFRNMITSVFVLIKYLFLT